MTAAIKDCEPCALYVCPGDPYGSPRGGQTAFAVQALNAFGGKFALVSPDETNRLPVGEWVEDQWRGQKIMRFNIGGYAPRNKSRRPLVPRRIVFRGLVRRHMPAILELGVRNLFCDSPELLGALRNCQLDSFCWRFAGLNNPVAVSRYPGLRFLAKLFHRQMIRNLIALEPDAVLASADQESIDAYARENPELSSRFPIRFFPTRFDPAIYKPGDPAKARDELGWQGAFPRMTLTGRLCWVKGQRLAIDAVKLLKQDFPRVSLRLIGDGEEREALEKRVRDLELQDNVIFDGFISPPEVRTRFVASDLCLVASEREGWSVAMAEALACGCVFVSTPVSGASEMVVNGKNGFVVPSRDPQAYADAIRDALALAGTMESSEFSQRLARRCSLATLADDWRAAWAPLREPS